MASIFGDIQSPIKILAPGSADAYKNSVEGAGLFMLLNNLIKFSIVIAGLYSFINIIMAGYTFLSSPESKDIGKAWSRIYQSMYGLLIIAGSFVLAAIFGWLIFGDATALLVPKLYGPK